MSTRTRERPRPLVSPLLPLPTEPLTPSAAPVSAEQPRSAEPRLYWGDRLGFRIWTVCFAILAGLIVVDTLYFFLNLLG